MITKYQYEDAQDVVKKYEQQQIVKLERGSDGDICLFDVLGKRARTMLSEKDRRVNNDSDLFYISDVVKFIKRDGSGYGRPTKAGRDAYTALMRIRGMGYKTHDEIMKYVEPHL